MRPAAKLLAPFSIFTVISCSQPSGLPNASSVTDSAGVPIVYTSLSDDGPRCRVGPEVLRIGSVDDDGTALFGVNGAVILSDGRVAVVNRGTSQVKVFSPSGDPASEFGRQGEGPGEFRNLWSVFVRGLDTLVVGDYRPWRFSFFRPNGELLRQVVLTPAVIERPDYATPLGPGFGFIMEEPSFDVQDEMVDRVIPLRVYGEDGALTGAVGSFWLDKFGFLSREIRYVGNPVFGARATFSRLHDDLILYGTGRYEQLEVWSVAGELKRIVRWSARERSVLPGDADLWRRQRRAAMEEQFEITEAMEPVINAQIGEHLPVATTYPGHGRVLVAQEGHIWVEQYRRPSDEGPNVWRVFSEDGQYACSVPLASTFRPFAVRDGRMVGLQRDSLDVEFVLGYDIEYP